MTPEYVTRARDLVRSIDQKVGRWVGEMEGEGRRTGEVGEGGGSGGDGWKKSRVEVRGGEGGEGGEAGGGWVVKKRSGGQKS